MLKAKKTLDFPNSQNWQVYFHLEEFQIKRKKVFASKKKNTHIFLTKNIVQADHKIKIKN